MSWSLLVGAARPCTILESGDGLAGRAMGHVRSRARDCCNAAIRCNTACRIPHPWHYDKRGDRYEDYPQEHKVRIFWWILRKILAWPTSP